jgi:hypothetical protein
MMPTFRFAQSDWDAAKRGAMVEAVQTAAGTITYGDLAPRIYRLAALHRQMGDANLIAIRDVR